MVDDTAAQVICYAVTGHACARFTFVASDCCHFLQVTSGIATAAKLRYCLSSSLEYRFQASFYCHLLG